MKLIVTVIEKTLAIRKIKKAFRMICEQIDKLESFEQIAVRAQEDCDKF